MNEANSIKERFTSDGFVFPLDAITSAQAADYRRRFTALEDRLEAYRIGRRGQVNHVHTVLRFVNEIARNDRILDAVEALIGPDILVWDCTFIIKEARSAGFVSWHQDVSYWGLEDEDAVVSAWLALGPVNRANGCMQFVRGSHRRGLVKHRDEYADGNILSRGQVAQVDIAENDVVHAELQAGQFSLHHGLVMHSSPANRSDSRRWGLVINYVAARNRQVVAPADLATPVRGEDRYGHFGHLPEPEADLGAEALGWHGRVVAARQWAQYARDESA